MSSRCFQCGRPLTHDEIGIYRRLINRGSERFMCLHCLSAYFNVEEKLIRERIEYYKKQGCTLFPKSPSE